MKKKLYNNIRKYYCVKYMGVGLYDNDMKTFIMYIVVDKDKTDSQIFCGKIKKKAKIIFTKLSS